MKRRFALAYLVGLLSVLLPQYAFGARGMDQLGKVRAFIYTKPPVFENNPFYSQKLIDEAWAMEDVLEIGYMRLKDTAGEFVNVRDGFRVTVGQPEQYDYTIWILGSSTIIDAMLPDAYTIPSQLQALIPDARVINAGANGARLANMRNRLYDLPIASGDMVVFYTGVMDSLTYDGSAAWVADIEKAINEARLYTEARGAIFILVLEPNALNNASLYEAAVIDLLHDQGAMVAAKFRLAYAAIRRLEPGAADVLACLDAYRADGHIVFIDHAHLGDPEAARLVAGCLLAILAPS
jgi:hypothetical protein